MYIHCFAVKQCFIYLQNFIALIENNFSDKMNFILTNILKSFTLERLIWNNTVKNSLSHAIDIPIYAWQKCGRLFFTC